MRRGFIYDTVKTLSLLVGVALLGPTPGAAQTVDLTLEKAVGIAMENSYRIKRLELGIERTRLYLKARQARLKSAVSLELKSPEFEKISDYKWNSTLRRDEIVRQDTRLWEAELSVRQPVILFGRPTNGYLSLNSRTYRYQQKENGASTTTWYNRYFVKLRQPVLQPNFLKNNITEAELDLQRENLEYIGDQIQLIDDVSDDYYDLFEQSFLRSVYSDHVESLERVVDIAEDIAFDDPSRELEKLQVQVELGNARERQLINRSRIRSETDRLKTTLGMNEEVSLRVRPRVEIRPLEVDPERAVQSGLERRPRIRELKIHKRQNEIDLDNTKGRNAFHLNVEMTYGMEKQDEMLDQLWSQYNNSYSVSVNAYVPIWDWGRRKALIAADRISVRRSELVIEEFEERIRSSILRAVTDQREYQRRALTMRDNLSSARSLTEASIEQYEQGRMTLQDLLRSVATQTETARRFLDAYLGYRRAILSLMTQTYYDFETEKPLIERFPIRDAG